MRKQAGRILAKKIAGGYTQKKRNSPNAHLGQFVREEIPKLRMTKGYSTILEPLAGDPTARRVVIRRLRTPKASSEEMAEGLGLSRITFWKAQERACVKLGIMEQKTSFDNWSNGQIIQFLKQNPQLNRSSDVKGPLALEIKRRKKRDGVDLLKLAYPRKLSTSQKALKKSVQARIDQGEKLEDIADEYTKQAGTISGLLILNVFSDGPRSIKEISREAGVSIHSTYERVLSQAVAEKRMPGESAKKVRKKSPSRRKVSGCSSLLYLQQLARKAITSFGRKSVLSSLTPKEKVLLKGWLLQPELIPLKNFCKGNEVETCHRYSLENKLHGMLSSPSI
jgi:hypothetical protein